jgi:polyisoprenoid-binding protein YceI
MTSTLTTTQERLPTGTWRLDPVHSRVGFAVGYLAGTFHGAFAPFDAELGVGDGGDVSLSGKARVDGVQVADENLGAHLLSPEFFDAERTPEISFSSTSVELADANVVVDGDLTIKGITKPVRLTGTVGGPVVDPYGRERLNFRLGTTVDRTAFGLEWNVPLPSGEPALERDVKLDAELALVKD